MGGTAEESVKLLFLHRYYSNSSRRSTQDPESRGPAAKLRSMIEGKRDRDRPRGVQTSMSASLYSGGWRMVLLFDGGGSGGVGDWYIGRSCSAETHPPFGASSMFMFRHFLRYLCLARSACRFRYQKKMTMARSRTAPVVDYTRLTLHLGNSECQTTYR